MPDRAFYPILIPTQRPFVEMFHCCHCHTDFSKGDPTFYIAHILGCLARHALSLRRAGLVSFADQSYPARPTSPSAASR
jgi:hypothetical protein